MKRAALLGLLVILVDQCIVAVLVRVAPGLMHSDLFFPFTPLVKVGGGLVVLAILWRLTRTGSKSGFILMACGFVGNLLSLVTYGHYMDYLPTGLSYINSSDLLVTVGAIIFVRERFLFFQRLDQ